MKAEIEAFAETAGRYCTLVDRAHHLPLRERMEAFAILLGDLCSRAVSLPDLEPTERELERYRPSPLAEWPGFERFELCWEVFDPYERDEPVESSLSNDVLEIRDDLVTGLALISTGREDDLADAVWDWRFLFYVHWGRHATRALRALHAALAELIDP